MASLGRFDVSWESHSGKRFSDVIGMRERRGIYRLRFGNGEAYVGQAVDVVRRFEQHVQRWGDIVGVDFRVEKGNLSKAEVDTVRYFEKPGYLRNSLLTIHRLGTYALDALVPRSAQDGWLVGEGIEPVAVERGGDISARPSARFDRLRERRDYDEIVDLLASYVGTALLWPRTTEQRFWFVQAMPNKKVDEAWRPLVAVYCHAVNVFGVYEAPTKNGTGLVARVRAAEPRLTGFRERLTSLRHSFRGAGVLDSAPGLGLIEDLTFKKRSDLVAYLKEPVLLRAARELPLARMRVGAVRGDRHSVQLATDVFEALDGREPVEAMST
ncbi:GIY-YIG nuclease family protein [Promicromonospora sp. NPDC057488]|uniref:GIY-YIG nuclease family protein n=1 Tax=Promicromonospora sp. NPDC057488 TaxID=3346147 RepID=UPI00366D4A3D